MYSYHTDIKYEIIDLLPSLFLLRYKNKASSTSLLSKVVKISYYVIYRNKLSTFLWPEWMGILYVTFISPFVTIE